MPAFNVDFWRHLFAAGGNGNGGGAGHPVTQLSLKTAELTAFDRPFHDMTLKAALIDDTWQAQVASRDVTGEFSWKADERGRLRARLKQLTLNETRPGHSLVAEEPLRELPGLDIVADNFTLRGRKLGKLELAATNEGNAWKMDRLAISSPDGTLVSDGLWRGGGTQLNFKLDVADIGRMLERLGYADAVKRGTAKLEERSPGPARPPRSTSPRSTAPSRRKPRTASSTSWTRASGACSASSACSPCRGASPWISATSSAKASPSMPSPAAPAPCMAC